MQQTSFADWVTTIEACSILNRSEGWLRMNYEKFEIERRKVGKAVLYRRDQVEALAKKMQGEGTA